MSIKKRVTNLRWGLCRGLLSGLLSTTSGVFEAPAGGWLLVEVLALFTSGPTSLSPYGSKNG